MTARTWFPTPDPSRRRAHDRPLRRGCGCPTGPTLDEWSRTDPAGFWTLVHEWLGIRWRTPPSSVVDRLDDPVQSVWFPGGRLSLVDCAVTRWIDEGRGEETALSWSTEGGLPGSWTYTELRDEVALVARGLSASGVSSGDRVGIQLPMRPEAAVTQLALAWLARSPCRSSSGFGAAAVADRLRASGATALVAAGGVTRRGRTHDLSEQTSAVTALVPGLEVCVTVGTPGPPGREAGPLMVTWEEIREHGEGPAPSEPLASTPTTP